MLGLLVGQYRSVPSDRISRVDAQDLSSLGAGVLKPSHRGVARRQPDVWGDIVRRLIDRSLVQDDGLLVTPQQAICVGRNPNLPRRVKRAEPHGLLS